MKKIPDYNFLKHQELFHSSPEKEVYLIGGFGCGKTTAIVAEAVSLSLANRGLPGMLTEPTYQMLEDILVPELLRYIKEREIEYKYIQSKHKLTLLESGSEIWLRSREKPLHLMGPNLAWAGCDEITLDRNEKSHHVILSRVRHPKAKCLKIFGGGTPDGLNWFWERYVRDGTTNGVEIIKASTRDNPNLPEEYYKRLMKRYPAQLVAAYLEGEFIPLTSGRVFVTYDPLIHLDDFLYRPGLDLLWAHDFNVDPLCSVILQREMMDNEKFIYYVIDEIVLRGGALTSEAVKLFADRFGKGPNKCRGKIQLYGDSSGSNRSTVASESDYKILIDTLGQHFKRGSIKDFHNKSNPSIRDSVNAMNALFRTLDGNIRIKLNKSKTIELQQSLLRTVYDQSTGSISKDGNEHLTDALRYLIQKEEPIVKPRVKIITKEREK